MEHLDDFELAKTAKEPLQEGPGGPREGFPVGLVAGVALMVAIVAGVAYLAFRKPSPAPAKSPPPASLAPKPSPATTPTAIALPRLDESDALVRDLAKALSADPLLGLWLGAKGLVRTFTVVVENVADGDSPRAHLGFLAPKGSFGAVRKQGRLVVDPRSYERYDAFADAVGSLDAAGCARVFRQLEPLFDAAYRELGHPEGGFSKTLARAIANLEKAPVLEADLRVRPVVRPVVVYELEDARLEALPPAQKHLLRMGPRNLRKVQAKLREVSDALGLPAAR